MTAREKKAVEEAALEKYRNSLREKMIAARWGNKTPEERSAHASMMARARLKKKKQSGKKPLAST